MKHKDVYFKDYCVHYGIDQNSASMYDSVDYYHTLEEAIEDWKFNRRMGRCAMISRYNDETERYEEIKYEEYPDCN